MRCSFFILNVITFLPLTVLPIERERERECMRKEIKEQGRETITSEDLG